MSPDVIDKGPEPPNQSGQTAAFVQTCSCRPSNFWVDPACPIHGVAPSFTMTTNAKPNDPPLWVGVEPAGEIPPTGFWIGRCAGCGDILAAAMDSEPDAEDYVRRPRLKVEHVVGSVTMGECVCPKRRYGEKDYGK